MADPGAPSEPPPYPQLPPEDPKTAAYPPQGYPPAQQPPPQQPQPVPPQGYVQQPPQQATTVVVTQPVVATQPVVFRDRPVTVVDSNGQQVQTVLEYRTGPLTWIICCLVCWITGCWCLALIPFCIDATKDVYHITPTDGKVVGVYKRL